MPALYSYTYSQDDGVWWGIQCSKEVYGEMLQKMQETRCFVYLTNLRGESLAIAVQGSHSGDMDIIFAPEWVLARLGISDGDDVTIDQILEPLPKASLVRIQPITSTTVEGPMFVEGLTEALNQLGVVQEGLLSAIVDPSMPDLHQFIVDDLNPAKVCLADGDLEVDLVSAVDYVADALVPVVAPLVAALIPRPLTPIPASEFASMLPLPSNTGFAAFSGRGRRLDGKDSGI
jgi:hypothetical protein